MEGTGLAGLRARKEITAGEPLEGEREGERGGKGCE